MKKMVMVVLCVMVMAAMAIDVGPAAAAAVPPWYNVTLSACAAMPNFYFLFCTSDDAVWTGTRVFLMDATNPATKPMLAAALTGFASSGKGSVWIPGFGGASDPPPANSFAQAVSAGSL